LAAAGKGVLIFDTDPQGNASTGLDIHPHDRNVTSYDVLVGQLPLSKAIMPTKVPNLFITAGDARLSGVEGELLGEAQPQHFLRNAIDKFRAESQLGVEHHAEVPSVYDVLIDGRPLHEVIAPVEGIAGLSCVPATIDLAGAEIELVSLVARETRLQRALAAYDGLVAGADRPRLDYVLIDCPPSLGLLTVNALVAAPEVLIPIQCEYYALEGVGQLLRNVELVKEHLNPGLHVSTVLLTMYDARTRLAAQVADEVRTHFPETVLRTTIPRSVRISEAPSYGQTVMTYDPGSTGALSYLEAAREMALRTALGSPGSGSEDTQ
jgi:chromosome partitioning protein